MNLDTKLHLMKYTDSYWTLLPDEVKDIILKYKDSQELIEWRESAQSRTLCHQLRLYGVLRERWQIGFIQCRPIPFKGSHFRLDDGTCSYGLECNHMRVYGVYLNTQGDKQKCLLAFSLERAIDNCPFRHWQYDLENHLHAIVYDRYPFRSP